MNTMAQNFETSLPFDLNTLRLRGCDSPTSEGMHSAVTGMHREEGNARFGGVLGQMAKNTQRVFVSLRRPRTKTRVHDPGIYR